ncbi:MAG: glycosyltransferase family 4 protein [Chloroflexota bacterium]
MGYPNVDHYQQLAEIHGVSDRVIFPGRIPFDQAPYYLAACDIAVAPKVSSTEGSGKLLNYMAMALPVVAYDTPVNYEYLGEWGVYPPLGDIPSFADAIGVLAHDLSAGNIWAISYGSEAWTCSVGRLLRTG